MGPRDDGGDPSRDSAASADKLVRRVPRWPATWVSQVPEMGVDVDDFVYRQGAPRRQRKDNVVLLSAAGFAPALAHAILRARRKTL